MRKVTPLPNPASVVRVRQRTWLVNEVVRPKPTSDATLVRLSCIDDDAAGEPLDVLWEMEVSPEIVPDEPQLIDRAEALDDPRMFGAYLNALRWNCVTSTDKRLLQAPFRAGIDLKPYQLEPLREALGSTSSSTARPSCPLNRYYRRRGPCTPDGCPVSRCQQGFVPRGKHRTIPSASASGGWLAAVVRGEATARSTGM